MILTGMYVHKQIKKRKAKKEAERQLEESRNNNIIDPSQEVHGRVSSSPSKHSHSCSECGGSGVVGQHFALSPTTTTTTTTSPSSAYRSDEVAKPVSSREFQKYIGRTSNDYLVTAAPPAYEEIVGPTVQHQQRQEAAIQSPTSTLPFSPSGQQQQHQQWYQYSSPTQTVLSMQSLTTQDFYATATGPVPTELPADIPVVHVDTSRVAELPAATRLERKASQASHHSSSDEGQIVANVPVELPS